MYTHTPHSHKTSLSISSSPMKLLEHARPLFLQRKCLFLPSSRRNQNSPTGSHSPKPTLPFSCPAEAVCFYFCRGGKHPASVSRHVTLVLPAPWGTAWGRSPALGHYPQLAAVNTRSVMSNSATPWTVAHEALPSMGIPRQEYWNGLPLPSQGSFPTQGLNLRLLHWRRDSLPLSHLGSPSTS